MRGSIRKRYKGSWSIVLEKYETVPETGGSKRRRIWYTVKGTKRDAEQKLGELLRQANRNELVEPSKLALGQWLDTWLDTAIKPPNKRLRSYETYRSVITRHLKPALGHIRLQQLQPTDLKGYYNQSSLASATRGSITSSYIVP